ncbi:rod shape-determining protein MreD [Fructobacillus ficulneus]|uniref:Cell shape determining protein MreD n=1 Tax=Fructobacillus ficulneus TaxID=157463 RepID=A0A0K8MJG7_9LACO|nr:rod shape-determining protein MreD [Fructobacillus ficulneus]GAP00005.1 cell shape determining protein MreD [Fructobacillus ficulneus]
MASWRFVRIKIVYPIVLVLLFLIDGNLMSSFGTLLLHPPFHIVPTLTLIWLFYGIQFEVADHVPFYFYVIGIGLLFDIYYTGILGTYTVAFLGAAVVMLKLRPFFDERLMSGLLLLLIGITVYFVVTYLAGSLINISNLSLIPFLVKELLPTAVMNLIIAAIGYYPVWSWYQRLI